MADTTYKNLKLARSTDWEKSNKCYKTQQLLSTFVEEVTTKDKS